jgi:anti-sigma regulatory factor (Ser/Thr protein kinase)
MRAEAAGLDDLGRIRRFVRESALALSGDVEAVPDLVLAVDEAVANIIRHGYKGTGPVEIEVERHDRDLVVHLRDEAPEFDPTRWAAPDLTMPLERRRAGGLGIPLARASVDRMQHRRRTGPGNQLTITKALTNKEA